MLTSQFLVASIHINHHHTIPCIPIKPLGSSGKTLGKSVRPWRFKCWEKALMNFSGSTSFLGDGENGFIAGLSWAYNYIDKLGVYGCLCMLMVEIVYIWIVSKVRISKPTYEGPREGSWEGIVQIRWLEGQHLLPHNGLYKTRKNTIQQGVLL